MKNQSPRASADTQCVRNIYIPVRGTTVNRDTGEQSEVLASVRYTVPYSSRVAALTRSTPEFLRDFNQNWHKSVFVVLVKPRGWGLIDAKANKKYPLFPLYIKHEGDTSERPYHSGDVRPNNPVDLNKMAGEMFLHHTSSIVNDPGSSPEQLMGSENDYWKIKNDIYHEILLFPPDKKKIALKARKDATYNRFYSVIGQDINQYEESLCIIKEHNSVDAEEQESMDIDIKNNLYTALYRFTLEIYAINEIINAVEKFPNLVQYGT